MSSIISVLKEQQLVFNRHRCLLNLSVQTSMVNENSAPQQLLAAQYYDKLVFQQQVRVSDTNKILPWLERTKLGNEKTAQRDKKKIRKRKQSRKKEFIQCSLGQLHQNFDIVFGGQSQEFQPLDVHSISK